MKDARAQHYLDEALKRPSALAYRVMADNLAAQGENEKAIDTLKESRGARPQ